ncbi:tyrosine-type recombinase/integrase [Streptomyces sp. NPDC056500]|uniref:tyrosine-type recombinase/integrase n=1 Tax=Streptomyces sp. NPDC056500 TaxID=3345840 RepID=UPI0036B5B26A
MSTGFFDFGAISRDAIDTSTIDQLADRFVDEKARKNPETGKRYRRELTFFFDTLRRFGGNPEEPSRQQVDRYLTYLGMEHQAGHPGPCDRECHQLPYAPASVARRRDVISAFYEYVSAVPSRTTYNPAKQLHVEKAEQAEVDVLTEDENREVWNAAKAHRWRDAVVVGLAGGLGLRREEVVRARAENLGTNERGNTLRFWRVKGRYWQTENLPTPVYDIVRASLNGRTHGPLVTAAKTKLIRNPDSGLLEPAHLSLRGLTYTFEQIRAYSGVRPDDLHCHLLRHTSITYACTLRDLSEKRIKKFYGHVSDKDHRRYNAWAHKAFTREIINPVQGPGFWDLTT